MPTPINITKYLLCFMSLVTLTLVKGCGQIGNIQGKGAHSYNASQNPTLENFASWEKSWKEGEWILGIGENPQTPPDPLKWRKIFEQSLLAGAKIGENEKAREQQARQALNSMIKLSFVSLNLGSLPQLLNSMNEPPLGFAFISLQNNAKFLEQFSTSHNLAPNATTSQIKFAVAKWQQESLANIPGVAFVEPNLVTYIPQDSDLGDSHAATGESTPPEFTQNSSMAETLKRLKASEAYEWAEQEKIEPAEVNVAVLDTGVDYLHPELKENIFVNPNETAGDGADNDNNCHIDDIHGIDATYDCSKDISVMPRPGAADLLGPGKSCPKRVGNVEEDLTPNCGHGTHVAGIIAAKPGGNLSAIGICPTCKIISVRVAERCLQPDTYFNNGECVKPLQEYDNTSKWEVDGGIADTSQIRGLAYLFNLRQKDKPDKLVTNVINMSLGKYFRSRAMSYVIRNLERLNIVVVAAAGNDNTDIASYPAAYTSVVSVCATGTRFHRGFFGKAIFSNFGDWVDICAPGVDIYSTVPGTDSRGNGRFAEKSGTSQATPFVAGAIGYLLSIFKDTKSGASIVRQLKAGANFDALYSADYNQLYKACYAKSDVCDYLLGAGFLDLYAAASGQNQSPVSESNGRAVTSGCVVSSIPASQGGFLSKGHLSSLPASLAAFLFFIPLVRVLKRKVFK